MGIMDRVKKASETEEDHLKMFLWGPNGSGKSTICGTAMRPVLYAFTERQGLQAFKRLAPEQDTLHVRNMADLRELLKFLKGDHGYKTICLDSFTEMQLMLIDELVARKEQDPEEPVKLSFKEFMFIHDKSKAIVRAFRNLPMHVVITCLSETVITGEGDNAKRVTRVMLTGQKLPGQIGQFFNLVGYTYKTLKDGDPIYKVLFEGRTDIDTKGLPGLRMREEPDINYWHERIFNGAEPRDADAKMIRQPVFKPTDEVEQDENEPESEKADETKPESELEAKTEKPKTEKKKTTKKGAK